VTSQTPRRIRTRYVVAVGACAAAVVAVVTLAVVLSDNITYFRTVSEALTRRVSDGTSTFRIAGAVVPGSIERTARQVSFRITDGKRTVVVDQDGDTPALFKDAAPVVCEGHWASGAALVFRSDRIMIKHGSDYQPPKVDTSKATS
jgi:cytochrome c-type biogenesis protein CcmE